VLANQLTGFVLPFSGLSSDWPRQELILWLLLHGCTHLAENLWPCTIGWLDFSLAKVTLFPHMEQAEESHHQLS
jgi:hypothetical protein